VKLICVLLSVAMGPAGAPQQPAERHVRVPPRSSARTLVHLDAGQEIVIRRLAVDPDSMLVAGRLPNPAPRAPMPALSAVPATLGVYIRVDGRPVEIVDPDHMTDVVRWRAPAVAQYDVRVRNSGDVAGVVGITVGETRGTPPPQLANPRADVLVFGASPSAAAALQPLYREYVVSVERDSRSSESEGTIVGFSQPTALAPAIAVNEHAAYNARQFAERLRQRVEVSLPREVLVIFFDPAETATVDLVRAAQFAYDAAFDGPVVAMSWPSDNTRAPLLAQALLSDVQGAFPAASLHVLGTGVAAAVGRVAIDLAVSARQPRLHIDQVVFVSPPVDLDLGGVLDGRARSTGTRFTAYVGTHARAERLSAAAIDVIHAGGFGNGLPSATRGAAATTTLADLKMALRGLPAVGRTGLTRVPVSSTGGAYWELGPAKGGSVR